MKKGKIIGFIAGVMIGAVIPTSILALQASPYDKKIEAAYRDVKIVVDGKEIHPTDVEGNKVEPFISNGTTYLPVRAVADALGKAVYWDGPNFTVYLGDMDGKLEYPTTKLEDMVDIGAGFDQSKKLKDNYGNRYERAETTAYSYMISSSSERYLLNYKYSRFKGTLYVTEGTSYVGEDAYFYIEADGRRIYTSPIIDETTAPIDIDVSVSGYNDIMLVFDGVRYDTVCLADAGFYQ